MYLTVCLFFVKPLVVSSWRIHWLYTHYYLTSQSITQSTYTSQPTRSTTRPNSIKLYRILHFMTLYKNAKRRRDWPNNNNKMTDWSICSLHFSSRTTTQNSMNFDRKLPCMTSSKIQQSVLIEQNETTSTKRLTSCFIFIEISEISFI